MKATILAKYPNIKSVFQALPASCYREISEKLPLTEAEFMQIDQVKALLD